MKFATKKKLATKKKAAAKKASAQSIASRQLRTMTPAAATVHMETLIASHEATAKDGRLEIVTALAMTTNLVTVQAAGSSFTVDPADVFDKLFQDVGITTADLVQTFLDNLTSLLPGIAATIAQIPQRPDMAIMLVVRVVRLALVQD